MVYRVTVHIGFIRLLFNNLFIFTELSGLLVYWALGSSIIVFLIGSRICVDVV